MPKKRNNRPTRKVQRPKAKRKAPRDVRGGTGGQRIEGEPTRLMNCLALYGDSLLNPFDTPPGCVPHSPALPSGKYKVWSKGYMYCGTGGFGFIAATDSVTSDVPMVKASNIGFSGGTTAFSSAGVQSYLSNSPFLLADLGDGLVQVRNVSMGIRIRYVGDNYTQLAGVTLPFEEPDHSPTLIRDGMTAQNMLAYADVHAMPITPSRNWTTITWTPRRPAEYEYRQTDPANSTIAIMVNGIAGAPFEYEVYSNFEAIGRNVVNPTPSAADDGLASRLTGTIAELRPKQRHSLASSGINHIDKWVRGTVMDQAQHLLMGGIRHGVLYASELAAGYAGLKSL